MLVLSREKGQSIVISDFLCTVTELKRDQVTLTISAEGQEDQVVKRKRDQSICIDDTITILVVEIRQIGTTGPLKVRLGVEAPKEVPVYRREVYDALKRNEEQESKD